MRQAQCVYAAKQYGLSSCGFQWVGGVLSAFVAADPADCPWQAASLFAASVINVTVTFIARQDYLWGFFKRLFYSWDWDSQEKTPSRPKRAEKSEGQGGGDGGGET